MTYLGFDVLDQQNHNMREAIATAFERFGSLTVNPSGRKQWDDFAGQPLTVRTFEWFANGRTECSTLRAFLEARQGRLVPVWVPTWCWDLNIATNALAGSASIVVSALGYTNLLFPFPARQHLAIVGGGTFVCRKVNTAVDNGDGTESLGLDAAIGSDLTAGKALVSFLTLCRLEEDRTPIRWYGRNNAEATIRFREVPLEIP